jgi:hypothetical protein
MMMMVIISLAFVVELDIWAQGQSVPDISWC